MLNLTIKTPERRWHRSGVFIVNFEHYFTPCSSVSIVNFEHVIASWVFVLEFYSAFILELSMQDYSNIPSK